jgi:hypothetical protein
MGLQTQVFNADSSREINAAFASFMRDRPDALFVGPGPFFVSRRVQLTQLAALHRMPAIYPVRQFVEAGGLMSYGASLMEAFRQVKPPRWSSARLKTPAQSVHANAARLATSARRARQRDRGQGRPPITTFTMRYIKGHFVVTGSDVPPMKFNSRVEARDWCRTHHPDRPDQGKRTSRPRPAKAERRTEGAR